MVIPPSQAEPSGLDVSTLNDSPLQQLHSAFLEQANINLYVKRDDLIHPQFGGNKWRKLKYNLDYARQQFDTLLTFGGAWSNHIYATAAAGKYFGFKTIGLIRGEEHTPLNATLSFARSCGMQLHYINRAEYRKKHEAEFLQKIKQQYGDIYILPEGGSNTLAIKGCKEIVDEISDQIDKPFDVICCASGTGATLAGIITSIQSDQYAIGFSALKGVDFLNEEVSQFLSEDNTKQNWRIEDRYHFGGYAKVDDSLIQFIKDFNSQYNIMLDAVYTGKMFFGLFQLIAEGHFNHGTTIVAVHSGGLQGNAGYNL